MRAQSLPSPELPTNALNRRILAIDYGRRRLGLALSDRMGITVTPLAIHSRSNRRDDMLRLREICRQHNVGTILVGWPLRLDGSAGAMAGETQRFAQRLRRELKLPVEMVDERLTSWQARHEVLESQSAGRRTKRPEDAVDDVAAALILRDYLSRQHPDSQE